MKNTKEENNREDTSGRKWRNKDADRTRLEENTVLQSLDLSNEQEAELLILE
jgi:hypothetical protein